MAKYTNRVCDRCKKEQQDNEFFYTFKSLRAVLKVKSQEGLSLFADYEQDVCEKCLISFLGNLNEGAKKAFEIIN